MKKNDFDEILDLKGIPCPQNSARSLLKLAGMETGKILEIVIDDGEPYENVPDSIENEGYKIFKTFKDNAGYWHLYLKV